MSGTKPNEAALDHILYLIVLPQEGARDVSSFQGFSSRLVNSEALRQGEVHAALARPAQQVAAYVPDVGARLSCGGGGVVGDQERGWVSRSGMEEP